MALNKRQYVDGQTIVTAANLNEIQDCIIAIEGAYVPKTRKVAGKALSSDITISASDVGAVPTSRTINAKALSGNITLSAADVGAVPVARTVNGKALSSNITLSAADVSAVPTTRTVNSKALSQDISLTASDVGAVPTGRTVNEKALSSDITLEASDVGAVPTSRTVNGKALSANITLASSDISDDSGAGGSTVKASLSVLNGSLNLLSKRRFVIIGDSYTEGYSPDNNVSNSWAELFKLYLGLTNNDCEIIYKGGAGFIGNSQGKSFIDLLADSAITSPNTVTDIIVAGGYNDKAATEANVKTAITTFCNSAKTKYPNARIYIAEIAWQKDGVGLYQLATLATKYLHGATENGAVFIGGSQYSMHNYYAFFSSDNIHPNQQGQSNIAYQIVNFFNGSAVDAAYPYTSIGLKNSPFSSQNASTNLASDMNNGLVNVSLKGTMVFTNGGVGVNMGSGDGNNLFDLGEMTAGYIFGNAYNTIVAFVFCQLTLSGTTYATTANLVFKNGHLYIGIKLNDSNGSAMQLSSVTSLTIYKFSASFNALMC